MSDSLSTQMLTIKFSIIDEEVLSKLSFTYVSCYISRVVSCKRLWPLPSYLFSSFLLKKIKTCPEILGDLTQKEVSCLIIHNPASLTFGHHEFILHESADFLSF